ncbi:MAG: NUDIX hydrolase [Calditrichia bacterium]
MQATNPYAATDVGIFRFREKTLQVFLVRLKGEPQKGKLAFPGSLLQMDENLQQASSRVYHEATGVEPGYVEQVFTFSDLHRDPRQRSISTAYMSFTTGEDEFIACDKYSGGSWFNAHSVNGLAYDHDNILETCLERIASKLNYTTIALFLLPKLFPLSDMQHLYEVCLDKSLDKRNFRKKILSMDIVEPSGQTLRGQKARPAMLYRATNNTLQTIPLFK